jgi:rubrerythrin
MINLLSRIPIDLEKIEIEDLDNEILRAAIIAELDAINLYEQMAALAQNKSIKTVLLDIAIEEKTHVGEFQALLLRSDKQQEKELAEGKKEVEELSAKLARYEKASLATLPPFKQNLLN